MGNSSSQKQNYLNPNPLTKMACKAKVNATVFEDGKCKINSVILEYNHKLRMEKVKVTYDDWKGDEEAQHYHKLQKNVNCVVLWNMMDALQSKINKNDSNLTSCPLTSPNTIDDLCKASGENNKLHSLVDVRRHGHPPKTRKVSNVKFVFKKKKCEDKKNKKNREKIKVHVYILSLNFI